jgi:hypothetical protein
MNHEELQRLLKQRPFRPFKIVLKDGGSFDVHYPEMNQVARSFIKIGIPECNEPDPICDHLEFVSLTRIARVEPLPRSGHFRVFVRNTPECEQKICASCFAGNLVLRSACT